MKATALDEAQIVRNSLSDSGFAAAFKTWFSIPWNVALLYGKRDDFIPIGVTGCK